MEVSELLIGGVSVIGVVVGLVEFSKQLGNKGVGLPVLAFSLGTVGGGVAGAIGLGLVPAVGLPWVNLAGIALGSGVAALTACGYYRLVKRVGASLAK